jgi:hypothetical protein
VVSQCWRMFLERRAQNLRLGHPLYYRLMRAWSRPLRIAVNRLLILDKPFSRRALCGLQCPDYPSVFLNCSD